MGQSFILGSAKQKTSARPPTSSRMTGIPCPVISLTMLSVTTFVRQFVMYAGRASLIKDSNDLFDLASNLGSIDAAGQGPEGSPGVGLIVSAKAFAYSTAFMAFCASR